MQNTNVLTCIYCIVDFYFTISALMTTETMESKKRLKQSSLSSFFNKQADEENRKSSAEVDVAPKKTKIGDSSESKEISGGDHLKLTSKQLSHNFPKDHNGRSFQSSMFPDFPWLEWNEEKQAVLCSICKQMKKQNCIPTSKSEQAFSDDGFTCRKNASKNFLEDAIEFICNLFVMTFFILLF